jgi:hypothetical protein
MLLMLITLMNRLKPQAALLAEARASPATH